MTNICNVMDRPSRTERWVRAGLRSLSTAANMSLSRSVLGASRDGFGRTMPSRMFKRNYMQDLTIKHKTGMPQVTSGPYGLGRYVAFAYPQQLGYG